VKVAVVGHGHMGREVAAVLQERGHEAVIVGRGVPYPAETPVGIDFTRPDAVLANIRAAFVAKSCYVVGTTGWTDHLAEVKALVDAEQGGLVHAANFSVGVNLFYRVVREAASILSRFPDYDPYILERHHRLKKDAPSGTARVLAGIVEASQGPRAHPVSDLEGGAIPPDAFHVSSVRAGGIVGEHVVGFDSGVDEILLEHRARSRRGFALGSVIAAEWIAGRRGFYAFSDVLDDSSSRR
jgi:4-hydroxy-tetrahydrodipicolinate reductase